MVPSSLGTELSGREKRSEEAKRASWGAEGGVRRSVSPKADWVMFFLPSVLSSHHHVRSALLNAGS